MSQTLHISGDLYLQRSLHALDIWTTTPSSHIKTRGPFGPPRSNMARGCRGQNVESAESYGLYPKLVQVLYLDKGKLSQPKFQLWSEFEPRSNQTKSVAWKSQGRNSLFYATPWTGDLCERAKKVPFSAKRWRWWVRSDSQTFWRIPIKKCFGRMPATG